jgi:hypothetical protein
MSFFRLVAIAFFAVPVSALRVAAADVPLTRGEVERSLIGRDVEQAGMLFHFDPGGTYGTSGGGRGGGGRWLLQADGRLCWQAGANFSGCFQYYRRAGELRVRRADGAGTADIGPVKVSESLRRGGGPTPAGGRPAPTPPPSPATTEADRPPYGRWSPMTGAACDAVGQSVVIEPGRIVVDYGGDLTTFSGVVAAGCRDGVCTFRQTRGNGVWTTRRIDGDRIGFMGPHGPAGNVRSVLKRIERCR